MKLFLALANSAGGYVWNTEKGKKQMKIFLAGDAFSTKKDMMKTYLSTPNTYEKTFDKDMKIHLAGVHSEDKRANAEDDFRQKICVLESFYYIKDWMIPYIKNDWDFLLDSGAFTFMNDKKTAKNVDWEICLNELMQLIKT
jgi:hypothetical protein